MVLIRKNCVLLVCLLFTFKSAFAITEAETTLVSLQTVFNHGVRSPLNVIRNNANNIWSRFGTNLGQLTSVGMKQMYDYGVYLRSKYSSLLTGSYDRTRAWAIATDHDRNLQSAQLVLTGAFQPSSFQVWIENSNLTGFLPIPVHTTPVALDTILHRHAPCDRFVQLQEAAKLDNSCNEIGNQDFLNRMRNFSGTPTFTYYDLWNIAEKALIDSAHNLTVDQYIQDNYARLMEIRDNNYITTYIQNNDMARLLSGALLNNIVSYFYRKINGTTRNELYLWGVFDYYVSAIQLLLNTTTKYTQPNFGAAFMFELRKDSKNNYYVQTLYKDNPLGVSNNLTPVQVKGCDFLCPVDTFRDLVASQLVTNFDFECQLRTYSFADSNFIYNQAVKFNLSALLYACLLFMSVLIYKISS